MKTLACFNVFLACALLTGCGGSGAYSSSTAPAPVADARQPLKDLIRVGDKITIRLTGVPDQGEQGFFSEIQIPASGTVSVPYLTDALPAAGHTGAELAAEITDAYKSQKIYTNPVITVVIEERYLNVGGDVRQPARVLYTPDSTVMSAINFCGGFTEYANRRAVRIIRGQQVIQVDCVKAASKGGSDPLVYPGDQIWVPRTIF